MGLLGKIGSAIGIGSRGSGGTRDAFKEFERYTADIQGDIDSMRARMVSEGVNPFIQDVGRAYSGLDLAMEQATRGSAQRLRSMGGSIQGLLRGSALARTSGAQAGAVNAARIASGGRGGLAFGGGAGALAARAGESAAITQSSALADAMLQGRQIQMGTEQAAFGIEHAGIGTRAGLAQSLLGMQASMVDQFRARQDALDIAAIQGKYGLAGSGMYAGLQGNQARQGRKTDLISSLLG